jgi:hypothetical protein
MSEAAIENVISDTFVELCKQLDKTIASAEEHEIKAQREQELAEVEWKLCAMNVSKIKERYLEDNNGDATGWFEAAAEQSDQIKERGDKWANRMIASYSGFEQVKGLIPAGAGDGTTASIFEDIGAANLSPEDAQKIWRKASETARKKREANLPTQREVRTALKNMKLTKKDLDYREPAIHLGNCLRRMRLLETDYHCDGAEIVKRMKDQSEKGKLEITDNLDWAIKLLTEIKGAL